MGRGTLSWGAEPTMGCGTLSRGGGTLLLGAEPYYEMRNPITGRGTLSWGAVPCLGALITKS